jgi:hypothetical protein
MSGTDRAASTRAPQNTSAIKVANTYPTAFTSHLSHLEVAGDIGQRLDHQPGDDCQE